MKGSKIIVPTQCRSGLLDKLHYSHLGIDKTKLRARHFIYWPGINRDIVIIVKTCETCQENGKRNNEDPALAREIPIFPWTLLEMDLFMMDDHSFLLVVDVTSQFPVIRILNNETCMSVLNTLKGIYCDFGLPKRVPSDNGPCFKTEEFVNFHIKFGVTIEKSSRMKFRMNC